MEIIILILMALGSLSSPDQFTQDYQNSHQTEIGKATSIYDNHQYKEEDGGVVIDDEANPHQ